MLPLFVRWDVNTESKTHTVEFYDTQSDTRIHITFTPGDFRSFTRNSGPLEPATLTAWLIDGPGIEPYLHNYGIQRK
jgi:hypothetical protein